MFVVLAHSSILSLFPGVRSGVSSCSSLLVVVSLATLVGPFTSPHLQGEVDLFCYSVPNCVHAVPVGETFENTIAANHNEVEIVLNFEALDIGVADDDIWVAAEARTFGLNISKGLGYRETAREDSQRSLNVKVLLSWACGCFGESLRPIYLSTSCLNTNLLKLVVGLVISR